MSFITVIFILMALSATALVGYMAVMPQRQASSSDMTIQRMQIIKSAVIVYRAQHTGVSPTTLNDLVTPNLPACSVDLVTTSPTYKKLVGWCGPYVDRPIQQDPNSFQTDGWGTAFQYTSTLLTSCGPNRVCGDADDAALSL